MSSSRETHTPIKSAHCPVLYCIFLHMLFNAEKWEHQSSPPYILTLRGPWLCRLAGKRCCADSSCPNASRWRERLWFPCPDFSSQTWEASDWPPRRRTAASLLPEISYDSSTGSSQARSLHSPGREAQTSVKTSNLRRNWRRPHNDTSAPVPRTSTDPISLLNRVQTSAAVGKHCPGQVEAQTAWQRCWQAVKRRGSLQWHLVV